MGQLISYTSPMGKAGRLPWVETYDPRIGSGSSALSANAAVYYRVRFSEQSPVTGIMFLVTVTGGNARVGIFDSADAGVTLDPRAISASTAIVAATAVQRVAFTSPFTPVVERDYWIAMAADSATPNFWRSTAPSSTLNAEGVIAVTKAATYAMDAAVSGHSGAAVTLWLRTY